MADEPTQPSVGPTFPGTVPRGRAGRRGGGTVYHGREKPVSHSLYFLAATWLAGQAGDARPMPQAGPGVIVESAPGGYVDGQTGGWQPQPQRRGLFGRLGGWFGGLFGRGNSGGPYYGSGQTIQQPTLRQQPLVYPLNTNEPPLAGAGKVSMAAPAPGNVVVSARVPLDPATPQGGNALMGLPVAGKYRDRIGHEADYSWITGQLYRVGNLWVLRYALPEE